MAGYAAFLRGINVGGHNLIRMSDLAAWFGSAGMTKVKTFIQSGNVIFESPEKDIDHLNRRLEDHISEKFGKRITTVVRRKEDLERILRSDPFGTTQWADQTKLYVCFLDRPPVIPSSFPLVNEKEGLVLTSIHEKDAFLVSLPLKNGRFGFPTPFVESELKALCTARNITTVQKMSALFSR